MLAELTAVAGVFDVLATRLRLIYLADGQLLDYTPDLDELLRFEKTLMAIWRAIQSAGAGGDFTAGQHKVTQADLLVHMLIDETLVHPFVATAQQHSSQAIGPGLYCSMVQLLPNRRKEHQRCRVSL